MHKVAAPAKREASCKKLQTKIWHPKIKWNVSWFFTTRFLSCLPHTGWSSFRCHDMHVCLDNLWPRPSDQWPRNCGCSRGQASLNFKLYFTKRHFYLFIFSIKESKLKRNSFLHSHSKNFKAKFLASNMIFFLVPGSLLQIMLANSFFSFQTRGIPADVGFLHHHRRIERLFLNDETIPNPLLFKALENECVSP